MARNLSQESFGATGYEIALKLLSVSESLQKCLPKYTSIENSNSAYFYSGIQ